MEDDEFLCHHLVAGKCAGEETQHGEIGQHSGIDTAARVADHERVAELQIEQMGRASEAQRAQALAASIRVKAAQANRVKVVDEAPKSKSAVKKIVTSG